MKDWANVAESHQLRFQNHLKILKYTFVAKLVSKLKKKNSLIVTDR